MKARVRPDIGRVGQWPSAALCCLVLLAWAPAAALAAPPGAGRLWEVVSPAVKNGADVRIDGAVRASALGDRVAYASTGNFAGGGGSGATLNGFLSSRSAGGWATVAVNPPYEQPDMTNFHHNFVYPSDLARVVATAVQMDPVLGGDQTNLFLYETGLESWTPLSFPVRPIPPIRSAVGNVFGAGSEDLRHVVFTSGRALTPDAPSDAALQRSYIYEWNAGQLRLVSYLPADEGGVPTAELVGVGGGTGSLAERQAGDFAVSADGSLVFYTTNPSTLGSNSRLYRVDMSGTGAPVSVRVNESERTDCAGDPSCGGDRRADRAPDPPEEAFFQSASADGSIAFFSSRERLTDDSRAGGTRADLYRWDGSAPVGQRLTDLTTGDRDGLGGGVAGDLVLGVGGVVGGDRDGTILYFVGTGALEGRAEQDQPNLYVWREDEGVRFITTLSPGDPDLAPTHTARFNHGRVTEDGRTLVFQSAAKVTQHDNGGRRQIYRYDLASDSTVCVSCNSRLGVSGGDAWLKRIPEDRAIVYQWEQRNVSADGRRVFFDSAEALVDEDTNGRIDVYEWNDGVVSLVSDGQSSDDSAFIDASATGDDAFFVTRAQLACQDTDNLLDVYDARVGGGLGCVRSDSCEGDACQGPLSPAPAFAGSGTSTFSDTSIPAAKRAKRKAKLVKCKRGFVRKRTARKVRCVKKRSRRAVNRPRGADAPRPRADERRRTGR
jgi:hypothetical protein